MKDFLAFVIIIIILMFFVCWGIEIVDGSHKTSREYYKAVPTIR